MKRNNTLCKVKKNIDIYVDLKNKNFAYDMTSQ